MRSSLRALLTPLAVALLLLSSSHALADEPVEVGGRQSAVGGVGVGVGRSFSPEFPRVPTSSYESPAAFVPGRVVVKWKPGRRGAGLQTLAVDDETPELGTARVRAAPGDEWAVLAQLRRNPNVEAADLDYVYRADRTPNDEFYQNFQWNMLKVDAPGAWEVTTGSSSVVVAVLDTGADSSHPDLAANLVPGWNFTGDWNGPNANTMDNYGHGTHVAGIVAAVGNNGIGVAGMAWNARVMPIKILDSTATGPDSLVARGIVYAVDHGARVVNLSLGGSNLGLDLKSAIDYARRRGAVVVAAAGNNAAEPAPGESEPNTPQYPAAYAPAIAVGATDQDDQRAYFSNYAPNVVDLAAPGVSIASTGYDPRTNPPTQGYYRGSGTSQATPHAAGLIALMLSINPGLSPSDVETILRETAVDLGPAGRDDEYGFGRINAGAAVRSARDYVGPATPSPTPTPSPTTSPTPSPTSTPTTIPTATPVPALVLSPNSLSYLAGTDQDPMPQQVEVLIAGGARLPWQASTTAPWLRLNGAATAQGITPSQFAIAVDAGGLPTGTTTTGSVTVMVDGVAASPQTIQLAVTRAGGPLTRRYLPTIFSRVWAGW